MRYLFFVIFIVGLFGCSQEVQNDPDTIIYNASVYTVNDTQSDAEGMAIKDGKITAIGTTEEIKKMAGNHTVIVDAKGQFVMPGFIEGHGHFSGLGKSLMNLNFLKSKTWDEIVTMVAEKAKNAEPGEWIIGGGWHQEKWSQTPDRNVDGYPYHDALSAVSPNNPVMLSHASGHALFANQTAMDQAGVSPETPDPIGGHIVRDDNAEALGVFEERAQQIIRAAYNEYLKSLSEKELTDDWYEGIRLAQEECLKKGITSFQDAGSRYIEIDRYSELAANGDLDLRLWVMLRHRYETMKDQMEGFPKINIGDHFFTCRAIKSEVDGALGAFGAWLLRPYRDKPDFHGQNTTPIKDVKNIADLAIAHDMQLCVHAIGDRANRVVLDIYEQVFSDNPQKQNIRWRIEHAQHLDTTDIPRFKSLGVIASMQGIHCTSDAPFVEKRLGQIRSQKGAYAWRSLLDKGVIIANGTDAPVEDVDPIPSFYASVTRKRVDSGLEFFPEQSMTREEAVYSYTLGNAFAAFEEDWKGSLEVGKVADFVILSKDLIRCSDDEILETEVLATYVDGKEKYRNESF
jgi:predicted amidohydrolase YtcJ